MRLRRCACGGLGVVFAAQAGSDTRSLLDYTERFLKQQPKVSGDSAQVRPSGASESHVVSSLPSFWHPALPLRRTHGAQVLGRQLEALVDRARTLRDQWGDKFVSVEHLVLAFTQDQRFGQTLMRSFALTADVRHRAPSYATPGVVVIEMPLSTTSRSSRR